MGWSQDTNNMEQVYRCSNFKVGYQGKPVFPILDYRNNHVTNTEYFL